MKFVGYLLDKLILEIYIYIIFVIYFVVYKQSERKVKVIILFQ